LNKEKGQYTLTVSIQKRGNRKPLKIAVVLHSDGLEGTGRSHIEMVSELVESGIEVHSFLPQDQSGLKSILIQLGSEVHIVGDLPWWTDSSNLLIRKIINSNLIDLIRSLEPDLILTQTGVIPQGAIAAKILNKPHVWCLREYIDLDHGLRIPFQKEAFASIVLELSEKVITNSKDIARYFYQAGNSKVEVIHPTNQNFQVLKTNKTLGKSLRLGVVATLSENKGQVFAIEAIKQLIKIGHEVSLELYGGGDPAYLQFLNAYVESNNLNSRVNFHGFITDRSEIYSNIDILLIPSKYEAYGRTALEAMQYSIPVVISDSAAMSENYLSRGICLSFESQNPISLAERVKLLASNPKLCDDLLFNASNFLSEQSVRVESSEFYRVVTEIVSNFNPKDQNSDITVVLSEILGLTEDHNRLTEDHNRLTEDHNRLTEDHNRLTEDHNRLTEDHNRLTEGITQIYSSEFWRATKPIRWFIGIFSVLLKRN
jgi:glycosyltransferase involved in cell wall biosynthesis